MDTVTTEHPRVNSLDPVYAFAEAMGRRGDYNPTSARLATGALKQLAEVLAEDEAKDPRSILERIEYLGTRWARTRSGKAGAETVKAYVRRAGQLLADYLRWESDPASFKPDQKRKAPPAKRAKSEVQSGGDAAPEPAFPVPARTTGGGRQLRDYPLGEGKRFEYALPEGGLTFADVAKIAAHLVTLANDFSPASHEQMRFFTIARELQ